MIEPRVISPQIVIPGSCVAIAGLPGVSDGFRVVRDVFCAVFGAFSRGF